MQPVFEAARQAPKRIVYAEGEDERVLRAAQTLVDDGIAAPILIGRRAVIEAQGARDGPAARPRRRRAGARSGRRTTTVFAPLVPEYQRLVGRRGVPPEVGGATGGHAPLGRRRDAAACRPSPMRRSAAAPATGGGRSSTSCRSFRAAPSVSRIYALSCLILPAGVLFICDTHMVVDPTAEQIAEMTLLAAEAVRGFGIDAEGGAAVAFQLRRQRHRFGAQDAPRPGDDPRARARRWRSTARCTPTRRWSRRSATARCPTAGCTGTANLLIMPTLDAANIAFNLLKAAADGLPVGPMLLGMSQADPRGGAQRHRARHRQPQRIGCVGRAGAEGRRMIELRPGLCPGPAKGLCPLDPRQGRSPRNPSLERLDGRGDLHRHGCCLTDDRRSGSTQ